MVTRIVMVEFNDEVTSQDIEEFRGWLLDLAARSQGLVRMNCGPHIEAAGESELNANAPNATFCGFASVWEFENRESLDAFVREPFHREMAGRDFRRMVKHRYVVNI